MGVLPVDVPLWTWVLFIKHLEPRPMTTRSPHPARVLQLQSRSCALSKSAEHVLNGVPWLCPYMRMLPLLYACLLDTHVDFCMHTTYQLVRLSCRVLHEYVLPKTQHSLAVKFAGGFCEVWQCERKLPEISENKESQRFCAQFRTKVGTKTCVECSSLSVASSSHMSHANFVPAFRIHITHSVGENSLEQ